MQAYVVSDNEAISNQIRATLMHGGHDCPDSQKLPLTQAAKAVRGGELIVVVMSPDPERALQALRDIFSELGGLSMRSASSKHVLAVGPADAKLILRTIREGAEEYLDETDIEGELTAVLVRIMGMGPLVNGEPGQLIAFLAPSGGSGSSLLSVNVATVLAREHHSTLLIDMKVGAGVLDAMLDLKPTHSLADLCRNADRLDRGMFEKLLVRHASGVQLLAPPNSINDISYVTGEGIRGGLAMARALFPYVVADMDRTYSEEQIEVLVQANLVLIVLRLDFTSLRNTRQTLDQLEKLGVDRNRMKLVVNRYGQPKEMRLAQAEEALGVKVFKYIPEDSKTVNKSINNGVPMVLDAPSTKIARSIAQLAQDVNGQVGEGVR